MTQALGMVYLVGAGPGDPKLITIRGLEAIQKADVIVYDRLASPRLLRHVKQGAEKIYVGKLPDRHTLKQEEINQLLVDKAKAGYVVTRLKGGDPSVFGRVGEEAEALAANGLPFEIIPGITSAIAVPAYAGIPVTHRDYTASLSIVTGHEDPTKMTSSLDWGKLATATGTSIFLMGVANLSYIVEQLVANGRPADTPIALIRWGTRAEQETITGTLTDIVAKVREAQFQSPAIIIVGEVVKLREKLNWYEKKPLFGQRVLVTRARSQASELSEMIDALGGEAFEFPVIELVPPACPAPLEGALKDIGTYDWVIFTSVNGVQFFFDKMKAMNLDIRSMGKAKIAAIGPKTADSLRDKGLVVDVLPGEFLAEGLLETIEPKLKKGERVLLPRADIARKVLPEELTKLGLDVTEVDVYDTVISGEDSAEVVQLLEEKGIHVITFTSSSTVTNFVQALGGRVDLSAALEDVCVACIGPITARTAEAAGLRVDVVAEQYTIKGLVDAIVAHRYALRA
jgi:uroporphyrinogen III methyltransferase/synthase